MAKRLICMLLAAVMMICLFPLAALGSGEGQEYPIGGTVKTIAGNLNIREKATTDSKSIGTLTSGNTVTVLGEEEGTKVEESTLWYKISYSDGVGYVHSVFIILDEPAPQPPAASEDPEFEKLLDAQDFPESYRPMLRALHKQYPNWKFESLKTGLDWNAVINAEYILGDSLIEKTASPSWKSYDQGRYSFSKSSFVTFDGGAYHAASREYLMYCMDPRNFLTETNVLMFFVAYGQEGETVEGIQRILSNLNWAKNYPDNNETVYIYEDGSYDIIINNQSSTSSDTTESQEVALAAETNSSDDSSNGQSLPEEMSPVDSSSESSSNDLLEESPSDEASSSNDSSDGSSSDNVSSAPEEFIPTKPVKEKIEIDSYAKAFYAAHKITGISAYMMASRIRQEQGVNGNSSGMGRVEGYEGYYNLWNIKTEGNNKFVQGAQYAKEQGWDTPLKSITGGSVWLDKNYFKTGQDTLYLQKYDVVAGGNGYYWHEYMTYLPAPWLEATILKLAFTDETIGNEAVFKIPIYNNMPSSPASCPTSEGTNNNYLQSITINNKEISNFDIYKQSYTDIVISNPSAIIEVKATPYDTGATVIGDGTLELEFGVNNIGIEVKASNGNVRKYTLSVVLNEGPADEGDAPQKPLSPTIDTTTLVIGDYITKIEPTTTVDSFIEALAVSNGTVEIIDLKGEKKEGETHIATGDTVVIYDASGEKNISYQTLIYGDVNCDGKVNSIDLLKAQRSIVGLDKIDDIQKLAADSNKDGKLNSVDLLITQRFIVGITTSIQGE